MRILLLFLIILCLASSSYAIDPKSNYLMWNDDLGYSKKSFSDLILKQNKKTKCNVGKFNETYELYKVLTEILEKHNIYSQEFLFLCLGIAAVETYNYQYLNNPVAQGIFQIEPATARYVIKSAKQNEEWTELLDVVTWKNSPLKKQLRENLEFQVVILYIGLQTKGLNIETLKLNRHMMAYVWKKYWNTHKGKGTVQQFKKRWVELKIAKLKREVCINEN